jgi:hypothetical protein
MYNSCGVIMAMFFPYHQNNGEILIMEIKIKY